MRYPSHTFRLLLLATTIAAPSLRAQWVSFQNETTTRLSVSNSLGAGDTEEKDYAWGDLDKDGDIDLVVVRKQPFTSGGHFQNVLLMNENGSLTDRSATLTVSTVPGSTAFLDATNDRDVVIADVNGDTWDDVITCTTLTAGQAQYIRVPRVYINMGTSGGTWQGLLYDDPLRIDDTIWGGVYLQDQKEQKEERLKLEALDEVVSSANEKKALELKRKETRKRQRVIAKGEGGDGEDDDPWAANPPLRVLLRPL